MRRAGGVVSLLLPVLVTVIGCSQSIPACEQAYSQVGDTDSIRLLMDDFRRTLDVVRKNENIMPPTALLPGSRRPPLLRLLPLRGHSPPGPLIVALAPGELTKQSLTAKHRQQTTAIHPDL